MPIFCFRCDSCGHYFEELVKSGVSGRRRCSLCGGGARKEFATFSIGGGRSGGGSSCAGCTRGSCAGCR